MSFRASVALTCTSVAPSAQRQPLPRRPWMPSCTTSECHFGASLHTPLHAPRRSALCATLCATSECPLCHLGEPVRSALCVTSHSAVLPARGYPSLFGSQCRLVANCQQRADATSGIFCEEDRRTGCCEHSILANHRKRLCNDLALMRNRRFLQNIGHG